MIATSTIVEDSTQRDGRRWIRERHTDHTGAMHDVVYLAESGENATTVMTARVDQILDQLRNAEIAANIAKALNGELVFSTNHSTGNQNLAALRETFKTATKWELLTLGYVIHTTRLSDNQLKNLFTVNDAQLPALKTKLSNLATRYTEALAEVGQ
jgi:hypothetical protein